MIQNLELFYLEDDETPSDEDEPTEAEVLRGKLCRSNDGCDWQLDDMDLNQYLDQYHDHKVMLVVASINAASQVENNRSVCSTCGFPLDDWGECLRCQWHSMVRARRRREELFQEIDRIVASCWTDGCG